MHCPHHSARSSFPDLGGSFVLLLILLKIVDQLPSCTMTAQIIIASLIRQFAVQYIYILRPKTPKNLPSTTQTVVDFGVPILFFSRHGFPRTRKFLRRKPQAEIQPVSRNRCASYAGTECLQIVAIINEEGAVRG